MPNRIIKESIRTSETVAELSDFEFRLWVGLIVSADDAGRGDARPAIIKGLVFPLRNSVTIRNIDEALHGLASKGCISLYEVDGKSYFWFPSWAEHQRIRDCKPKYPEPPADAFSRQVAASCGELPQVAADCGELRPESESESESESNTNPNPKRESRFAPPTREDAQAYFAKIGATFSLDAWFAYYEQNGWMVGRGKMKDWKASMRYWQTKEPKQKLKGGQQRPFDQSSIDVKAEIARMDKMIKRMEAKRESP